jgi:isopentenyl-diphosphate delta-isomerase
VNYPDRARQQGERYTRAGCGAASSPSRRSIACPVVVGAAGGAREATGPRLERGQVSERRTVVLVDEAGQVLGEAPKLEAHEPPGRLHLAFSVFLFQPDGRVLLQRRAEGKYHFPGAWANACCSHPGPGEDLLASAEERVMEELGITCALRWVGSFVYRASCAVSGLVEHELDHVLIGTTLKEPAPDPNEVAETRWVVPASLLGQPSATLEGPLAPWLLPALHLATRGGEESLEAALGNR